MNKFNDNDIREALRRSEAKRQPAEVPGDFLANVMSEIEAESKTVKIWRWVAAAACIALVAGIGSAILFTDRTIQESEIIAETPVVENAENEQSAEIINDTVTEPVAIPEPKVEAPKAKPAAKPKPAAEPQPAPNPNLRIERPQYAENEPTTIATDTAKTNITATQDVARTDYAEYQPENDSPNFSPALMDEFIEVLAEFQGVNKINSECSIANDSNFVETFYVFPVKEEFDVLGQFV